MRLLTALRQLASELRAQKMRTTLTVLGITWGTVAVVVLLAFGVGLEEHMKREALGIGDGVVIVFPGRTTQAFEGFGEGRPVRLREDDVRALRHEIDAIESISPEYGQRMPTRHGGAMTQAYVTGVAPEYARVRNIIVGTDGRFINEPDVDRRRRVVVLGDGVEARLFGDEDALGRGIMIGDAPFTVIGVMEPKAQNSSYNARDTDRVFIPSSTHRTSFGEEYLNNFIYRPVDPAASGHAQQQIYEVLGARHRFDPTDRDALGVWDTAEIMEFFDLLFLGFNLFLGVVGSFTLTVGGIGVANIMYVVVRERTREIGIKRSLGARRRDILLQFVFETFIVVAFGAALGLVISYALIALVGLLPLEELVGRATISPLVLTSTLTLLALIAFFAGLFPARKAANLDPVECLRY